MFVLFYKPEGGLKEKLNKEVLTGKLTIINFKLIFLLKCFRNKFNWLSKEKRRLENISFIKHEIIKHLRMIF